MSDNERTKIIDEINKRIEDATNSDNYEIVCEWENFYEWFLEHYVY